MSTQEQKWTLEQLKEFYRNASYAFTSYDDPMRDYLTRRISRYGMKSVFEFGCGMGKNLVVLKGKMPKLICYGIDLNAPAVDYGHRKFGLDLHEGDEIKKEPTMTAEKKSSVQDKLNKLRKKA